jgi:hypothetical protein
MLLALSKPAWIWAKTLSGSQHSPAGQLAGIGGETVGVAVVHELSPEGSADRRACITTNEMQSVGDQSLSGRAVKLPFLPDMTAGS